MTTFTHGSQAGARFCTVYYAEGATPTWSELATDLSQHLTDITAGSNQAYETNTTRMDWMASDGYRTIRVQCTMDNTDTGTFFRHGSTNRERLHMSSAGNIRVDLNGSIWTFAITDIDGSTDTFDILWQTFPNPDTTGASDAMRSVLVIYNVSNTTVQRETFTHPVKTGETATAYWGASDSGSTSVFSGSILKVGYDRQVVTLEQVIEDWHTSSTAPTTNVKQEREWAPLAEGGVGEVGEIYGPSACWSARAHRQARRRTFSPLVNERHWNNLTTWRTTNVDANNKTIAAPAGGGYRCYIPLTWRRPVPELCNVFWVRVHLHTWVTSGAAVPIGLRMFSADGWPGSGKITDWRFVEEVVTRDDTSSGDGQWNLNGYAPIVRDADGWSYFFLAFEIDPAAASANDANARFELSGVTILPRVREDAGGGIPLGGGHAGE